MYMLKTIKISNRGSGKFAKNNAGIKIFPNGKKYI